MNNAKKYLFIILCILVLCLHVWNTTMVLCDARGGQKMASDPLELALQMVVSHHVWVLGIKSGPSARAATALKHLAISPALQRNFLNKGQ